MSGAGGAVAVAVARENQTSFMRMFVVKVMMEDFKAARKEKPKADREEGTGRSVEEILKSMGL